MAKKKRLHKKKHQGQTDGQENNSDEFLAQAPERNDFSESEPESPEYPEHEENSLPENEQNDDHGPDHELTQEQALEKSQQNENDEKEPRPSFSLGTYLKDERENQGISLKNISQSTKISTTNLEFLEQDNLALLPDKAYVIGYVKSYARLLGVDVNLCIELLNKTYQSQGETKKEPEIVISRAQKSPQIAKEAPIGKIIALAAMVIILLGIGWFFGGREGDNSSDTRREETPIIPQEEDFEQAQVTPQTLNADSPLQEDISDQPMGEKTESPKEEEEKTQAQAEKEKVSNKEENPKEKKEEEKEEEYKFYKMVTPLYSKDTTMDEAQKAKLLPPNFRTTPAKGVLAIFITAVNGDSWLTYKSDNDPIKKFILKKGRSLLFRAKTAQVFLGNVNAVKIFLNNEPIKVASSSGVKSLIFPQEKASEFVTPLFIYKKDGSVQTSKEWLEKKRP